MTPGTPTWHDITRFLQADGWVQVEHFGAERRHVFWEKALPGGRVMQAHTSRAVDAPVGAKRFSLILSEQLQVVPRGGSERGDERRADGSEGILRPPG